MTPNTVPYQTPYSQQGPIMTVKDWILTFIISIIPLVNIIMLFVWAFVDGTNPNKRNYARASLIMAAIVIVLYILIIAVIFALFGAAGGFSGNQFF
ncbi:hypothetical protein E1757_11565 [Paenibacillus piri]|uniref:Uncharacterized protein n=2 Tax=Paenibacillus piri TaxID=2547395 RepID=A0A4R5KRC3_9BACL|nr:hypothetical protein E1757_11565 [Paenibacillus piri]